MCKYYNQIWPQCYCHINGLMYSHNGYTRDTFYIVLTVLLVFWKFTKNLCQSRDWKKTCWDKGNTVLYPQLSDMFVCSGSRVSPVLWWVVCMPVWGVMACPKLSYPKPCMFYLQTLSRLCLSMGILGRTWENIFLTISYKINSTSFYCDDSRLSYMHAYKIKN